MHNALDFTSWQSLLTTLFGLAAFSLVVVGIRLLVMQTVQMKRERANRQINERLRTLIAAYKTLGGSFTGNLTVDPTHLRELRARTAAGGNAADVDGEAGVGGVDDARDPALGLDRRRRVRDAVEAALSDVILLGTEEQVRLAVKAANDMVAGRAVETAELVVSLRAFIRDVLDLEPIAAELAVPRQGPARPSAAGARGRGEGREAGGGAGRGARGGGGGGGGGMAAGGGGGMLGGVGVGVHDAGEDPHAT
jgi:hypothetical protein